MQQASQNSSQSAPLRLSPTMVLSNPNNGDPQAAEPEQQYQDTGDTFDTTAESHRLSEELDSTCSTPYVSAPSSPGRGPSGPTGYFFSAPASPVHFILSTAPSTSSGSVLLPYESLASSGSFDFEFCSRYSPNSSTRKGSMSSADELFLNGQIRPIKLSSHLERPQILTPLFDRNDEDEESIRRDSEYEKCEEMVIRGRDMRLRSRSLHRKARSQSPLRTAENEWHGETIVCQSQDVLEVAEDAENSKRSDRTSIETTLSGSACSSRSSSSGRNSKKWIFLKDLLYKSKSEGSGNYREKFWSSISFSPLPSKERKLASPTLTPSSSKDGKLKNQMEPQMQKRDKQTPAKKSISGRATNDIFKRRVTLSPHELHYTANRAQAEEMKKKTFLPYRQGLLGCLGFSSKGYGAFNGLTRTLNPVSSR